MTRKRRSRRPHRARWVWSTAVVAVLATFGYALSGQPVEPARLALYACVLVALAFLIVALRHRIPGRFARAATIVATNVAVGLVVLELSLVLLVAVRPSPLFSDLDSSVESLVRRKAQEPGWTFMGFPFNSQGFYDEEFAPKDPTTFRVVSIADSFVWGAAPHAHHFTTVCERLTGAEVLNLGYSATGPDVYDYLVRYHAPSLEPDLIVVNLFVGNDLGELVRPEGAGVWSRVLDRERLLLFQIPRRLWILSREASRQVAEADVGRAAQAARANPLTIWKGPVCAPEDLARTYPWLDDPMLERPTLSEESFLDIETRRAAAICVPQLLARTEPLFLEKIERIVQSVGDTPLVFVLIPDEFQIEEPLWERVAARLPARAQRFYVQQRLAQWFEAHDVPYVDLLPRLRAMPLHADGKRHLYHARDTHFNRFGNEVAGQALAEYVNALQGGR